MPTPDTPAAEPMFTRARLRPLGSLILFVLVAMVALFGAATVATAQPAVDTMQGSTSSGNLPWPSRSSAT